MTIINHFSCFRCDDFEVSECFAYQQAEFFFSQQAALLEVKESDALPPTALQNKIRQVLKSNPDLTQAVSLCCTALIYTHYTVCFIIFFMRSCALGQVK